MQLIFRTHINNTSPQQAFDLIANIDDYETWLPNSNTFYGIRHISDNPVKEGTIYTDGRGRLEMHGKVITYKPPTQIAFEQTSTFRPLGLISSGLDITIDYVLVQEHDGTTVIRNYEVDFKGILKLMRPFVMSRIKAENDRILHIMKDVLEKTY